MSQSLVDTLLQGLAPVSAPNARVLILGSMPGAVSLQAQQYYAHPRNAFWPLMANLCQCSDALEYNERLLQLQHSGIALWDVIGHCMREGSLDSAIKQEQVNDFAGFFAQHTQLQALAFNGAKAWHSFKRYVLPQQIVPPHLQLISLPSTSPAHAAMSLADKSAAWRQLAPYLI